MASLDKPPVTKRPDDGSGDKPQELNDLEQVATANDKNNPEDPNKKETFGQWIDKALEEFPEIKEFIEGTSEIFALVKEVSLDFLETTKGLLDKEQVGGLLKKVSKDIKGAPNKLVTATQSLLHYFYDKIDSFKTKRSDKNEERYEKYNGAESTPNSRKAFDYLKANLPELNEIQIAGIVGNLMAESGPSLKIDAKGDIALSKIRGEGKRGEAFGLAQWRLNRKERLMKFIREKFNGKNTMESQLAFLIAELRGDYPGAEGALKKLKTAKSVEDAAKYFSEKFEKPKKKHDNSHLINRIAFAKTFLDSYEETYPA